MSVDGPGLSSQQMLYALNQLARQGKVRLFEGVPAHVKARRRAAGKVAKRSRKVNRG
jgi:hypothetical protein